MSSLSSIIGQHYAYANGRIGVLQQLLLAQSDIDRMLGSGSRREMEQILTELKMTSQIDQSISTGEEILRALEAWVAAEVEQMAPTAKAPVFNVLWFAGDEPLVAYLIKQSFGLTSVISTEPTSHLSAYSADALRALILEDTVDASLPPRLVSFVQNIQKETNLSPKQIDALVAQYFADTKIALARASGSKAILSYVRHSIDTANIRTALRLAETEEIEEYLIAGGFLAPKKLRGSAEEILRAVDASVIALNEKELRHAQEGPVELERVLSELIARDIALMWNIPLSIEPLFAFAAIALAQISLIRVILIGKSNGIEPQELKSITPPFLSASHYLT